MSGAIPRPPRAPEASVGAAVTPLVPRDGIDTLVRRQQAEIDRLKELASQLEEALESRIVIEQAKGILAARLDCSVDQAFEILRRSARSHRIRVHDLAAEVVADRSVAPRLTSVLNPSWSAQT